jgi:hypothetical protein
VESWFSYPYSMTGNMPNDALNDLLKWIAQNLVNTKAPNHVDVAIQCLQIILRNSYYRERVWLAPSVCST